MVQPYIPLVPQCSRILLSGAKTPKECLEMATCVHDARLQQPGKDGGAGIALSADTTHPRAADGAATLASKEPLGPDALLPVFDLAEYLSGRGDPDASLAQCCALAECLRGAAIIPANCRCSVLVGATLKERQVLS